jgi:hypothetical protein
MRALDERSFADASFRSTAFRRQGDRIVIKHGRLDIRLAPYAYVHISSRTRMDRVARRSREV